MSAFGPLLKVYREYRNMSQSALARAAEFDHSFVSRLETGSRRPDRNTVLAFAAALSLDDTHTDRLLASADFRPREIASVLYEPMLADLDELIAAAPSDIADDLRGTIRVLLLTGRTRYAEEVSAA